MFTKSKSVETLAENDLSEAVTSTPQVHPYYAESFVPHTYKEALMIEDC